MIALRTKRSRSTAPLATVLLMLQGLAAGVLPLAHASERLSAPAHIEAQHATPCLALHDALRCALCHYAATRVVAGHTRVQSAPAIHVEPCLTRSAVAPTGGSEHLTAPARPPPALLV